MITELIIILKQQAFLKHNNEQTYYLPVDSFGATHTFGRWL